MPSGVPKVHHGTQIEESHCGKKKNQYCSRLTLSPALAQHTGSYRCRYRQKQRKQASVYVYITGKNLQVNAYTYKPVKPFLASFPSRAGHLTDRFRFLRLNRKVCEAYNIQTPFSLKQNIPLSECLAQFHISFFVLR